jgi:hypothetical protein
MEEDVIEFEEDAWRSQSDIFSNYSDGVTANDKAVLLVNFLLGFGL